MDKVLRPGVYDVDGVRVRIYESMRLSTIKRIIRDLKKIEDDVDK